MSARPFESYLVDVFVEWATGKIKAGVRYQFQSPDHNNASKLYQAYLDRKSGAIEYKGVELPFIACGATKLLPVMHGENGNGFSENYISHLRDCVAGPAADFVDCALLIIHNSKLDTIINSADDLAAEGRAWHPQVLASHLKVLAQGHQGNGNLLTCLLEEQLKYVVSEGATVFGLAPLYQAIADGDIRLSKLGLFDDPMMASLDNLAQIRKRLEENRDLRRQIERVTENFADQVEDKLREQFGPKFIRDHFVDSQDWKTLTYGDFKKELDTNRIQSLTLEALGHANGKLIERAKSASKAGRKDLSVLLELPDEAEDGQFEITFLDSDVALSELKVSQSSIDKDAIVLKVSHAGGKRSRVQVRAPFHGEPLFFTLALSRRVSAENHQFRCLFLRQGTFFVDGFKNHFRVEPNAKRVTLQMEANRLAIADSEGPDFVSEDPRDVIDNTAYASVDFSRQANASEKIGFQIAHGDQRLSFQVEGAAAEESVSLPLIYDRDRYQRLFQDDEYRAEFGAHGNRMVIDNRESAVAGVRQLLLTREATMVAHRLLYQSSTKQVRVDDLREIDGDLHAAYEAWYTYLSAYGTVPSLVSWGPQYRELTAAVTQGYERALAAIPRDSVLSEAYKRLLRVGMAEYDGKEFMTPFHPLNLAYQLQLVETIVADRKAGHESFATLPDVTRERLTAAGLIPFVYDGANSVAHVSAIRENACWLELIQKDSSLSYVRSLVRDKLAEFTQAYERLFRAGPRSTLIVNVINMGPAGELFRGLIDYFKKHPEDACAIHVNCYDDQIQFNEFDAFAECVSTQALRETYQLGRGGVHDTADLLIDLIRSRLTYSKFKTPKDDEPLAYAHLAFFRNNAPVDVRPVRVESALSGVLCDGLIAGESAENIENAYFSSFGLRNVEVEPYQTLRLARLVGALMRPARESNSPYLGTSVGLAASTAFRDLLTRSYDSALWTTIVDPKVTLDFFTSQRDVVLIHYSDQYTSSAGYDAITVTKQVDLFRRLLGKDSLLSEFNAFNGGWLLQMLTANENTRKERRGIIGAYKFVRSLLIDADITWVPLSIAEMIRVSGNVGLKMSGSDFSRGSQGYTRGAISDDVLFVGFRGEHMYLLPLEVKTGARPDYAKAVEQARELKRFLQDQILGPNTMASKLYRGLFVRQVLMQVEKYRLYGVLGDADLQHLTSRREWWLKGDYRVAELRDYPSGVVVAHLDSETCFDSSYRMDEDVLLIDLPIGLLESLIDAASAEQIRALRTQCHVPAEYLLTDASYAPRASAPTEETVITSAPGGASPSVDEAPVAALTPTGGNLRIRVGENVTTQQALYWEPTNTARFMNSNAGIIGTMGTGKTQFTKSVVAQLVRNQSQNVKGAPIGMLIFDYKSDYIDDAFIQATNAKKFQLSSLPYNPLSLFGDKPMLPLHTAAGFAETMARAYGLGTKQQLKLESLIVQCYASVGIHPQDKASWSKTAPTIEDVWQLFLKQEKVEEDSLYAALRKLATFQIFEPDPTKATSLYDLVTGVTVVELAGFSSEIQNLVVALTLDLFYAQMQKRGKPEIVGDFRQITKMILVDEADNFMSQDFPALRRILKEGREYGVGVILSTQDITHFKTAENDYSSYILSWVVHRVSQIKNADVKAIFNKDDKADQEQLMEVIRKLEKHHSLFIDGEKRIQKMRDSTFWELLLH